MKTLIIVIALFFSFDSWSQEDCMLSDSVYYRDSVSLWTKAFREAFHVPDRLTVFDPNLLDSLYEMDSNTTVRIYLTMNSEDFSSTPGLVLFTVPKNNCSKDDTSHVLIAGEKGKVGKIVAYNDSLRTILTNWRTIMDDPRMSAYETIYGYNFTWAHLDEARDAKQTGLRILYGLSKENENGSQLPAIHLYLTTDGVSMNKNFIDFSSPCPKMCGNLVTE